MIEASFWPGLSLSSNRKQVPDQRSTSKQLTSMSSELEPTIWSRDTGQRKPCFDSCQLTIYQRCPLSVGVQLEYGHHIGLLLLLLLLGYY